MNFDESVLRDPNELVNAIMETISEEGLGQLVPSIFTILNSQGYFRNENVKDEFRAIETIDQFINYLKKYPIHENLIKNITKDHLSVLDKMGLKMIKNDQWRDVVSLMVSMKNQFANAKKNSLDKDSLDNLTNDHNNMIKF